MSTIKSGPKPRTLLPNTSTQAASTQSSTQTGATAQTEAATQTTEASSTPSSSRTQHQFQRYQGQDQSVLPTAEQIPTPVSQDPALSQSLNAQLRNAHVAGGRQLTHVSEQQSRATMPPGSGNTGLTGTGRLGGTGALGLNDPNVAPAREHAASVQNQRVDWSNRAGILNNMSQIDSDQGVHAGGNDAVRCGAASLVAGSVLQGPESFQAGLGRIHERGESLRQDLAASTHYEGNDGQRYEMNAAGRQQIQAGMVQPLQGALDTIDSLRQRDPSTLTNGDMQRLQEAVYTVGIMDQRTTSRGEYSLRQQNMPGNPEQMNHYLTTGTMQTYRDLMWGDQAPQMNGRDLDVSWVSNETAAGGGHFVLADNQGGNQGRSIAFNPWPDADGTAFSRGVDGQGFRVIPETQEQQNGALRGIDIDNDTTARRLPNR